MAEFRLFYFDQAELVEREVLQAPGLLDATRHASSRRPDLTVEIWSEEKKVAIVRPAR